MVDAARLEGWAFWILDGVLNGDGDYILMLACSCPARGSYINACLLVFNRGLAHDERIISV